ncbi:MAG: TolC family protein [Pseudomonadota bacterium]|nr:TolC family protein [Pseudomonadota bacterium]
MKLHFMAWSLVLAGLAGCASYKSEPLDLHPTLLGAVPHIKIDPRQMPLPELKAHPFPSDPSQGLDMTDVAMLAVVNDPDLQSARDDAHIAYAQAFAAGLLPDPSFSGEVDLPKPAMQASDTHAFNGGLNWDIGSLLTYSANHKAALYAAKQTDLNLLWQEWQVVSQARILFSQNVEDEALLKVLKQNRDILKSRYDHTQQALAQGLVTADVASADLSALSDINTQINDRETDLNAKHSQLCALLNLDPSVKLNLVGDAQLPAIDDTKVKSILPDLPARRPDLLALKAGYQSQDETYRAAILGQFPDINIGINRQRDTSNVYSTGYLVSFNLPIFNRNRGNIAVAKATRQKLYDDFESRLNAAYRDIDAILVDEPLLQRQLSETEKGLSQLQQAAKGATAAYAAGDLDELSYANLRSGLLAKQVEYIKLKESILEQDIALQTLIGSELPTETTN